MMIHVMISLKSIGFLFYSVSNFRIFSDALNFLFTFTRNILEQL